MLRIQTLHPVAVDSVDHVFPRGTKNDESRNPAFNECLLNISDRMIPSVLDLGCSGGSFVQSLREMNVEAVGVEGSDYSKKMGRAAWSKIPGCLFTADITRPFLLLDIDRLYRFDVVTAWEVLEHLTDEGLDGLALNIHAHLRPKGLFIGSVNTASDLFEGIEYHLSVHPEGWWRSWFHLYGFEARDDLRDAIHPNWVRGPNTDGASSVPLVMQKRL